MARKTGMARKGTYLLRVDEAERQRLRLGFSHAALSERVGVHPRTLTRWYSGQKLYASNATALSVALSIPVQSLMHDCEELTDFQTPVEQASFTLNIAGNGKSISEDMKCLARHMEEAMHNYRLDLQHPEAEGFGAWLEGKKERQKKPGPHSRINVYFVPAYDEATDTTAFFYALASQSLHNEMRESLKRGILPTFAVIVARGYGKPSEDLKEYIKHCYGFDHNAAVRDGNTPDNMRKAET